MHTADPSSLGSPTRPWRARVRASLVHLGLSVAVAALAAALVFGLWYPYPYRETSGGRDLFQLVVMVDIIVGPLITLAVFDVRKPWRVMRRDLVVIAVLQLAALGYGLHTVYAARPVHLVFEYHRFQVVHAVDVAPELLAKAPANLHTMPLMGPTMLSLRPFKDNQEMMRSTEAALAGVPQAAQADLWRSYEAAREEVRQAAKPLSELQARFPTQSPAIAASVAASGRPASALGAIPMIDRQFAWTVLVDRNTAEVVGFLPLDSF